MMLAAWMSVAASRPGWERTKRASWWRGMLRASAISRREWLGAERSSRARGCQAGEEASGTGHWASGPEEGSVVGVGVVGM